MSEQPYSVLDKRNPCYRADRCTMNGACEQFGHCVTYAAVVPRQHWRIVRAASACGGRWAWARLTPGGVWAMQGCVCHHPWTLVTRW